MGFREGIELGLHYLNFKRQHDYQQQQLEMDKEREERLVKYAQLGINLGQAREAREKTEGEALADYRKKYLGILEQRTEASKDPIKSLMQNYLEAGTPEVQQGILGSIQALTQAKTTPKIPTDANAYISNYLQTKGLPANSENWMKAHQAYTYETKIVPGIARIGALGSTRGMAVTDKVTGETKPMSWNDYNALSKANPGRFVSPQYDSATQMGIRAYRDLSPNGRTGQQLTSYDQFLQHTGQLWDAVGSLDNTNFPYMNKSINWLKQNSGKPEVAAFLAKLAPPLKEFETLLLGGRALYEEDRREAKAIIDASSSPAQMKAVLPSLIHTGTARLSALNNSFKRATGEDIPDMLSEDSRAVLQRMGLEQPEFAAAPSLRSQPAKAAPAASTFDVDALVKRMQTNRQRRH